jgi:hypothetical protein
VSIGPSAKGAPALSSFNVGGLETGVLSFIPTGVSNTTLSITLSKLCIPALRMPSCIKSEYTA